MTLMDTFFLNRLKVQIVSIFTTRLRKRPLFVFFIIESRYQIFNKILVYFLLLQW